MSDKVKLSASKIKTSEECSWKYWCKYHLKLPDTNNDGARRGSICHVILECLGNPRHKKRHYKSLLKRGIKEGSSIDRLIRKLSKGLELNLDSYEPIISKNLVKGKLDLLGDYVDLSTDKISNLGMIYHLVDEGLKHDMYGDTYYKPTHSHDEIAFDIEKEDYNIRGFIDKLFIYKKDGKVLIRDFKTSKKSFAGKDLEDNMQALIYALAVKDMYPDSIKGDICVEFVFLRLMGRKGDVIRYKVGENELLGFEEFLKHVQSKMDNYTIDDAQAGFAKYKGYPSDGSFSGKMLCGRAERKGQLKRDGNIMWHCPFKFDFDYYALINKDDDTISTAFKIEDLLNHPEFDNCSLEERKYNGCPAHTSS